MFVSLLHNFFLLFCALFISFLYYVWHYKNKIMCVELFFFFLFAKIFLLHLEFKKSVLFFKRKLISYAISHIIILSPIFYNLSSLLINMKPIFCIKKNMKPFFISSVSLFGVKYSALLALYTFVKSKKSFTWT